VLGISTALLGLASVHGTSALPCNTQTNIDCVSVPSNVKAVFIVFGVISVVVSIFFLICEAKIISKAGYSGWFVLTGFVPILNIVMFIIFAFAKWPVQEQLEAAQRGAGRGYYNPPPSTQGAPPGPAPGHGPGGPGPAGPVGPAGPWGPPAVQAGAPVPPSASPAAVDVQTRGNAGVIYCSWCGKERAVDAQSIHHCGSMQRPPAYCMNCGTALAEGAPSCTACGTPSTQLSR
jgi:hypothetical protein